MSLMKCPECNKEISDSAITCPNCGHPMRMSTESKLHTYYDIISVIQQNHKFKIRNGLFKRFFWFLLANAGIVLSVCILSGGIFLEVTPYILAYGCLFPFIALLFSKSLVKKVHRVKIIKENDFANSQEESLYAMVKTLSEKAGIKKVPEVGIYSSEDMNAFATGASKNHSLIAFSSSLITRLDENAVAAVAAHEIAHIANGDMVTMSLVQSVINSIVLVITIPLSTIKILASISDTGDVLMYYVISFTKFIITSILLLLGSLVVKSFSRHREFQADKLASMLVNKESMIFALESLGQEDVAPVKEQRAYAAFKINSPKHFLDIFSTHPSIDRRIQRLQRLS